MASNDSHGVAPHSPSTAGISGSNNANGVGGSNASGSNANTDRGEQRRYAFRRNSFATPTSEGLEASAASEPGKPVTLDDPTTSRPTLPPPRGRGGSDPHRSVVAFAIPSPSQSSRRRESSLVSSIAAFSTTPHTGAGPAQLPQYSPTESDAADDDDDDDPPPVSTGTAPGAHEAPYEDNNDDDDDDTTAPAFAHVRFARRSSSVVWTALPKLNVRRRSSIGLALMLNSSGDAEALLTASGNPLQEPMATSRDGASSSPRSNAREDPNVVDLTGLHHAAHGAPLAMLPAKALPTTPHHAGGEPPTSAAAAAVGGLDYQGDNGPISATSSFVFAHRPLPPPPPPVGRRESATTTSTASPQLHHHTGGFSFPHADSDVQGGLTDDAVIPAHRHPQAPPMPDHSPTSPVFSPTQSFVLGHGASGAVRSGFFTPGSPVPQSLGRGRTPTLHATDMAHVTSKPSEMADVGDDATPAAIKIIRETSEDKAASAQCELAFAKRMAAYLTNDPSGTDELNHLVRIYHVHRDRIARETAIAMELLPGTTVRDIPVFADLRSASHTDDSSSSNGGDGRRESSASACSALVDRAADVDATSSASASSSAVIKDILGRPCLQDDDVASCSPFSPSPRQQQQHAAGSAMRAVQSTSTLASVAGTPELGASPAGRRRRLPRSGGGSGHPSPASTTPSRVLSHSLSQAARLDTALRHVTVGTLRGLRALHEELRVVHRDVKPANLLLDHSGAVKVADFGVAFTLPEGADVRTGATGQAGSIAYMAPECIRGEPNGSPGDVWALGVTLLELAGGEHPYAARSTGGGSAARFWSVATSLGALEGPPEREAKVDAIVSAHMDAHVRGLSRRAGFEAFVRRCLAGDPNDRPSAAELLRDPWLTGPR